MPLKLDSRTPRIGYERWAMAETRFRALSQALPDRAKLLMAQGQLEAAARWKLYEALASTTSSPFAPPAAADGPARFGTKE
jgi:hypothetical protein